jgi:hypothetical protein
MFSVRVLETPFISESGDGVLTFTGAVSYRLEWSGNEGRGTLPLFLPQGLAEVTTVPDPTVQGQSQVTWVGAGTEGSKTKYVFSVDAGEAGAFVAMINQLSNAARESTAERDRLMPAREQAVKDAQMWRNYNGE